MKIKKISVVGLGYVGAPLLFNLINKGFNSIGYDKSENRINELTHNIDKTGELDNKELNLLTKKVSVNPSILMNSDIFIITVPTPIDNKNIPDISLVKNATSLVAKYIKKDSIFILESTVYPGLTEEICVPIIKKITGLECNYGKDRGGFHIGYSPERINPGDKIHRLDNTVKIISASSDFAKKKLQVLYNSITNNNIHFAKSIKIAEAAKIIENIQRDLNIALMNELQMLFSKMNIDTNEVINAASTKWNFQKFNPGLVGGHCISVDPYYLTYRAKKFRFKPKVILAGRKTNDNMPLYFAKSFTNKIKNKFPNIKKFKILVCGITFKMNVPDIRNSKAITLIDHLIKEKFLVDVYDPVYFDVNPSHNLNLRIKKTTKELNKYHSILIAVEHDIFKSKKLNKHLVNKKDPLLTLNDL